MTSEVAYNVDIAICIDAGSGMQPILDEFRSKTVRLGHDIRRSFASKGKGIAELRVRVIGFRDLRTDAEAIKVSGFFSLPDADTALNDFVRALRVTGEANGAESGLHALAIAMQSDWTSDGDRRRHIIVVLTDEPAHPLEDASFPSSLNLGGPMTFDALTDAWEVGRAGLKLDTNVRRLILFAPDDPSWNQISDAWEQTVHVPQKAGEFLSDGYATVTDLIGTSI